MPRCPGRGLRAWLLCACALFAGAVGAASVHEEVTLVTAAGKRATFRVEIADSVSERRRGLMHRDALDADAGMLFLYRPAQPVAIWMKNTLLALDILFIDADGRVAHVVQEAVPLSEKPMPSRGPVRAVLEINGGRARELGLGVGDRVLYAPLWPEPAP